MVLSTLRYRSFMRLGWHAAMQAVDGWGQRAVIMMLLQSMGHHDIEDGDGEEEIGRACLRSEGAVDPPHRRFVWKTRLERLPAGVPGRHRTHTDSVPRINVPRRSAHPPAPWRRGATRRCFRHQSRGLSFVGA